MNDLKKGSYDVTVTIGPSYQTARQETLATLIDAAEAMPQSRSSARIFWSRTLIRPTPRKWRAAFGSR